MRLRHVPSGAARRDYQLAGTGRSSQGRAVVWRGEVTLDGEHRSEHCDMVSTGGVGGNMIPLVSFEQRVLDSRADDSLRASATIDHSDIRGSEPHGHDPSGAASD